MQGKWILVNLGKMVRKMASVPSRDNDGFESDNSRCHEGTDPIFRTIFRTIFPNLNSWLVLRSADGISVE
jgi:hypothetical protein